MKPVIYCSVTVAACLLALSAGAQEVRLSNFLEGSNVETNERLESLDRVLNRLDQLTWSYAALAERLDQLEEKIEASEFGLSSASFGFFMNDVSERLDALERTLKTLTPTSSSRSGNTFTERFEVLGDWLDKVVGVRPPSNGFSGSYYSGASLSDRLRDLESMLGSMAGSSYSTPNLSDLSRDMRDQKRKIDDLEDEISSLKRTVNDLKSALR